LASLLVLCLAPSASCLSAALPVAAMSKATISPTGSFTYYGETSILAKPSSEEYINYTPKPERAPVTEPLSLKDIAIGMISGLPQYSRALHRAVLQYAPKGVILHSKGKCACSFRFGIETLKLNYPKAKWYYVGDDDAFINLDNLVETLSAHDSSAKVVAAGATSYVHHRCNSEAIGGNGMTFYGGTGHILSAGLVHSAEYSEKLRQPCNPPHATGADVEHACTVLPLWTPEYSFVDLKYQRVLKSRSLNGQKQFMASPPDFLVAHHLNPRQISSLAKLNRHLPKRHSKVQKLQLPDQRCAVPR